MTIGSWLLWLPISSGCSLPGREQSFDAGEERLRAAVRAALGPLFPDVREEECVIVTGWSREFSSGEQGLFLGNEYRYRARHEIRVAGSRVEVRSAVESRAAGGPRSRRWVRTDPRGVQETLFDAIQKEIERS